jgi:hypothetical protein
MATATKDTPATIGQLNQPRPNPIDNDAHQADMARRKAEIDARRPEMIRCLNPAYASAREMEKPQFRFTVSAEWYGQEDGDGLAQIDSEQTVVAQNEADAWAKFCDKIGRWPSPRDAKRTIKRGKQVSAETVAAAQRTNQDADSEIPRKTIGAVSKKRK